MKPICIRVLIMLACIQLLTSTASAQLLNSPESVAFDPLRNCHYVSNWGDGLIIKIDSLGNQSVLSAALTRIAGLLLVHDTLYVASNDTPYIGVVGLNPASGELILYAPMEGAGLPNDLAFDSQGALYCTDYWSHKIYRIDIPTQTAWVYVEYVAGPNGIIYDPFNDRMLVVTWTNEQNSMGLVKAINFADSTIAVAVDPHVNALDGLEIDNQGRVYFSSWQTNSIHRYDAALTSLEVFSSGHDAPADITFNPDKTILQIANFNRNTVDFVAIPPEHAAEHEQVFDYHVYPCYPNPFNSSTTLKFSLANPMLVNVTAYDIKGRTIGVLLNDSMNAGTHELDVKGDNWASGTYFLQLRADNMRSVSRVTLLK